MLLTITGQNLASEFIDLGLNYAQPLPTELGGVRVLFNDVPAEIFQVAPDHIICVPPASVENQKQASVQVVSGTQRGTPFVLPSTFATWGLLTRAFPGLPPAGVVDGYIFNADGTQNDAQHPAAPGSTVTLIATGLSGPREIALLWNAPVLPPDPTGMSGQRIYGLYGKAYHAPGLMDALYAIDFRIPDAPGQGVYLVPVPGVLTRAVIGWVNSGLGV